MQTQILENPHIGSQSYLSSDYLNLFTEIVILLEEVTDYPEYMDDIRDWKARSYCDHFRASSLPFSDLAIWAYEHAPSDNLERFNDLVDIAIELIVECQEKVEIAIKARSLDAQRSWLVSQTKQIRDVLDQAGLLIDRNEHHVSQADIDKLLGF